MSEPTWTGTWCPQCGADVTCDEDGCCVVCGATAVGEGAEQALDLRRRALAAEARLTRDGWDAYRDGVIAGTIERIAAWLENRHMRQLEIDARAGWSSGSADALEGLTAELRSGDWKA